MKLRSSIIAFLVLGSLLLGANYPKVNPADKEGMIFHAVLSIMDQMHFSPQYLDDEFSKKVFDYYLKSIDGNKRFLTQEDYDQLAADRLNIDNEATERSLAFFNKSYATMLQSLEKSKKIYNELINQPFDLSKKEELELDSEKRPYAKNDAELKEYWRKYLKYEILSKAYDIIEDGKEGEEMKVFEDVEEEARKDVKEIFDGWFERLDKVERSDRFETYINTFTHAYDPHSDYFNPKEKQDFDINMGGKLEGIGARLQTEKDFTKVVSIVPGGPAWKNKELDVDDLILMVKQEDEEESKDLTGMRIDDVVQLIRGKKGTVVSLKIKKGDGTIKEIKIERDEVIIDDSFARSLILDVPGSVENIGYIYLPKFYSSFDGPEGTSCAEDVGKEIDKLKAEHVGGIILDLRYNGGGSLNDVVDMSGHFIKNGPIVQVKPRENKPYVYDDKNNEVKWDGALIVMVNSFSASASEILAAALQDYNRAVIVGSNSTYGKGTVQRFYDLDRMLRGNSEYKPLGQVKLTMQKFYRINGGSTQLKGVIPDIILPDRFSMMDVGEKEYDNAMPWSEIGAVPFSDENTKVSNLPSLRQRSESRIAQNETFAQILDNAQRLKDNKDKTLIPLDYESYSKLFFERKNEAKKFDNIMDKPLVDMKLRNLKADMAYIKSDSSRIARNDSWIEGLSKDVYLFETLQIMRDMTTEL